MWHPLSPKVPILLVDGFNISFSSNFQLSPYLVKLQLRVVDRFVYLLTVEIVAAKEHNRWSMFSMETVISRMHKMAAIGTFS